MYTYIDIIRELREDKGLSQSDMAKVLNTTQQVYSRYETGANEIPVRHILTLCDFFGVTADYLLGRQK